MNRVISVMRWVKRRRNRTKAGIWGPLLFFFVVFTISKRKNLNSSAQMKRSGDFIRSSILAEKTAKKERRKNTSVYNARRVIHF